MVIFKLKTTNSRMSKMLDTGRELTTDVGEANLLKEGNKARYLGGGWWSISGTDAALFKIRATEKLLKCTEILDKIINS